MEIPKPGTEFESQLRSALQLQQRQILNPLNQNGSSLSDFFSKQLISFKYTGILDCLIPFVNESQDSGSQVWLLDPGGS